MLAEQDVLLAGRRGVLAELTLPGAEAEATATAHEDKQEQDDDPPGTAGACAVIVSGDGCKIAQRIVIHI